jgi:uncharacterized membrane protein
MENNYNYNHNYIKENSLLRADAREQLRGKWGIAILLFIIFAFAPSIASFIPIPFFNIIVSFIVTGPLTLGYIFCYMQLVRNEPFRIEDIFEGFKHFGISLKLYLLTNLFKALWALPYTICIVAFYIIITININAILDYPSLSLLPLAALPLSTLGIIAHYRYAMAFYILNDNLEIGALEAINESKLIMEGYKWKLFCLHLSFIGWILLAICLCCIGVLWVIPYMQASEANFYQNLKLAREGKIPVF